MILESQISSYSKGGLFLCQELRMGYHVNQLVNQLCNVRHRNQLVILKLSLACWCMPVIQPEDGEFHFGLL